MKNGASHVNHNTVGDSRHYQILDDVPGVENGVVLQKVIFAWITRNLQLSSHS